MDHERAPMNDRNVDDIKMSSEGDEESQIKSQYTRATSGYRTLIRFILPLLVVGMAPEIAEQALNRGITSIASDDMVELLATFGLSYYIVKLLCGSAVEVRQMTVVLVHSRRDYFLLVSLSATVGLVFTIILLITGLTQFGHWLIRDVHRQSDEVTEITTNIILYLSPSPLIEAVATFHEGGLIKYKHTAYAGAAKFVDFGMQILFVIVLLFTPTRTNPILIPIFAIYAGFVARLILDVGFFFILVWPKIPKHHETEKPATLRAGLLFWIPLALVKSTQIVTRPVINLAVSRTMADISVEAATKELAVMTATFPVGRVTITWLNDLRAVIPTFYKKRAEQHFSIKMLTTFAAGCTLSVFVLNVLLFAVPQINFSIMYYLMGLTKELANMSYMPLAIYGFVTLFVGIRAHSTSWLLYKKQTMILIPSALIRLATLFLGLAILPYTGITGAALGLASQLFSSFFETMAVVGAVVFIKFRPRLPCRRERQSGQ